MRKQKKLAPEVAEQMLMNVFDACRREPNTVPLSVLTSYASYRKERYSLQNTIIILMLVLFILMPMLFAAPKITAEQTDDTTAPVYTVRVSTMIPVSELRAKIDGTYMTVTEIASHVYEVRPEINGEMRVTAELMNRQRSELTVTVSGVDLRRPVLVEQRFEDDDLYLYIRDDDSGVDWQNIYVGDEEKTVSVSFSYDTETGWICLACPKTDMVVFVPDMAGNVLQIRLTAG